MKKLMFATALTMMSSLAWSHGLGDDQECLVKGGIYVQGTCITSSVSTQVALVLGNDHRKGGGNETSMGDHVVEFEGQISKELENRRFKTIFINISAVPQDQTLNYQEKLEQNFHNSSRLKADGYVDRPWLLANIGANIEITESQDLTLLAGSFEASGLAPLEGKPSRYYMTAPYGIVVRYDKGIQANYELKNELDRVILASLSVIDGDSIKGQSSIQPSDSRANSYPAYSGTFELQVANALQRVFDGIAPYLDNHDLYVGVTGNSGDTGSFPGEKRRQDDMTSYLGYVLKTSKGQGEVRVFKSSFNRNAANDGSGRHGKQVGSNGQGVELAIRGIETKRCDWELYGNKHQFESENGADNEFTWGNVKTVDGWTVGASCKNFKKVPNLDIGFEYGYVDAYDAEGKETNQFGGQQFGLVLSYKMGLKKKKSH